MGYRVCQLTLCHNYILIIQVNIKASDTKAGACRSSILSNICFKKRKEKAGHSYINRGFEGSLMYEMMAAICSYFEKSQGEKDDCFVTNIRKSAFYEENSHRQRTPMGNMPSQQNIMPSPLPLYSSPFQALQHQSVFCQLFAIFYFTILSIYLLDNEVK